MSIHREKDSILNFFVTPECFFDRNNHRIDRLRLARTLGFSGSVEHQAKQLPLYMKCYRHSFMHMYKGSPMKNESVHEKWCMKDME